MTPSRAAWVGAAIGYGMIALVGWTMFMETTPDGQRLGDLFGLTAILGTPLAAAAAILAYRLAATARGDDLAERIVGLAAASVDGPREEWATAMRAELASIDDRRERRRFAVGCALASLRSGVGRAVWLTAIASGAIVAVNIFNASRDSLGGDRAGIMGTMFLAALPLLFLVPLVAAAATGSFRTGLITGGLCLLTVFVATLAVWMAEGAHWYQVAGVFVLDGDPPKGGVLDLRTAVLDPLGFVIPVLTLWAPWPVFGAAAGARLTRHRHREAAPPATQAMV